MIDYIKLRSGDIFFSRSNNLIGSIIRFGEGKKAKCNHTGFIIEIYKQFFAVEVDKNGIRINSLEKYKKKNNFITAIYRWEHLDVNYWCEYIALWIRRHQEAGYDLWGAITSSKLLPFVIDNKKKEFCSENVYDVLIKMNAFFPLTWQDKNPTPFDLYKWMESNHHFEEIL